MIKTFVYTTLLILGIVGTPTISYAQTSCSPVTSSNFSACCGVGANGVNAIACKAYNGGYSTTQTTGTQDGSDPNPPIVGGMCDYIGSYNSDMCCGRYYSQNQIKCDAYNNGYYTPGTIGSGVPGTTIINTTGTGTGATVAATPQAGSSQLASCNNIRFVSLLDILIWVKCIIVVAIIPLIFTLALLFFLWGVMKFIGASDSTKKEEGKKFIIAGLIGLFVMTSLWGIIKILGTTLGIDSTVPMLQTTYLKK